MCFVYANIRDTSNIFNNIMIICESFNVFYRHIACMMMWERGTRHVNTLKFKYFSSVYVLRCVHIWQKRVVGWRQWWKGLKKYHHYAVLSPLSHYQTQKSARFSILTFIPFYAIICYYLSGFCIISFLNFMFYDYFVAVRELSSVGVLCVRRSA